VSGYRPYSTMPPVVLALLLANGGMFLLELFAADLLINGFALWPLVASVSPLSGMAAPPFEPWQLLSYSFLHGGVMHLLLNMYALWLFGSRMENVWGSKAFVLCHPPGSY